MDTNETIRLLVAVLNQQGTFRAERSGESDIDIEGPEGDAFTLTVQPML